MISGTTSNSLFSRIILEFSTGYDLALQERTPNPRDFGQHLANSTFLTPEMVPQKPRAPETLAEKMGYQFGVWTLTPILFVVRYS
jgi:hypothetical protein